MINEKKVQERVNNLKEQHQKVLNQLANMTNPNDSVLLMQARDMTKGAIELGEIILAEDKEEDKEKDNAKSKSG